MKVCTRCGSEKPLTEFGTHHGTSDGIRPYCKACGVAYTIAWEANNQERRNAYRRANPVPSNRGDARYETHLRKTYGLTLEDYEAMLEAQDYGCAICGGQGSRRLVVDHCHATERVRGLLCDKCNIGLGWFRDDPELMDRAIGYLAGAA